MRADRAGSVVVLPAIVRWYRSDFGGAEGLAGLSRASLAQCLESILPLLPEGRREELRALVVAGKVKIKVAKFEWALRTGLRASDFEERSDGREEGC